MKQICKNCGTNFEAKNKRALFCSSSCRVSFHQQQKRRKEKKPLYRLKKYLLDKGVVIALSIFIVLTVIYVYIPDIISNVNDTRLQDISRKYKAEQKINTKLLDMIETGQNNKDKDLNNININKLKEYINSKRNQYHSNIDTIIIRSNGEK